jgi:hypothetical protein
MKIWEPKPPGTLWATPGLLRASFNFTFYKFYVEKFIARHMTQDYYKIIPVFL